MVHGLGAPSSACPVVRTAKFLLAHGTLQTSCSIIKFPAVYHPVRFRALNFTTISQRDLNLPASPDPKNLLPSRAARELRRIANGLKHRPVQERLQKARQHRVKELFKALRLHQRSGLGPHGLDPQGQVDALWAMSVFGDSFLFQTEMELILQAAEFEAKDFQLRQLVDAAWSLASAAHWSPQLSSIAAAVVVHGGLRCLSSFQCTSLLWSLAILDHSYPILFRDAEPFNAAETFNSAQLCSCCWSLSVLQQEKSELFRTLWNQLGSSARSELKLNVRMAAQLSQVRKTLELNDVDLPSNKNLLDRAKNLWETALGQPGSLQVSAQHADVSKALVGMGAKHIIEDTSSGYAVDLALPEEGIAVEIDGPSHFSRTDGRLLGATALKRRHLQLMGWHVFSITHEDWQSALRAEARLQELRELIHQHRSGKG